MASKNVILTDKVGNQLAPATTAEQVRYDSTTNVKQAIGQASGHATTANTAADMTDTTRIYVYTGSESGYTAGNWYYYDGSAWVSGGQYTDGVQFETDTTLSVSGKAADAEVVGDELNSVKEDFNNVFSDVTAETIMKDVLTYGGNYYPGSGGDKTALATQSWYEVTAKNDFHLWSVPGVTYPSIIIAVYNNGTATHANFVARYRKSSSENTLPTESNKLSITAGQLLAISVQNDAYFSFISDGMDTGQMAFNDGILLSAEMVAQTQDKISITVGTDNYDIKFGDYSIKFAHITNTNSRADLWNFNGITKGSATVVGRATDIIGVLREDGESDFMGGVHGNETNVDFYILADGTPITEDIDCDRIDILMYSHLTRVSTGDNVIDRVAHITIMKGVIETEVTFKSLVDNFAAYRVFAGGMWAWYEVDKVYATSNIGEIAGSGSSGVGVQRSHDLYTATIITNDYTAICENIIGKDVEGSYGSAFYYGNEANPRMKMYLGALENIVLNTRDIIKGKARYTLI